MSSAYVPTVHSEHVRFCMETDAEEACHLLPAIVLEYQMGIYLITCLLAPGYVELRWMGSKGAGILRVVLVKGCIHVSYLL